MKLEKLNSFNLTIDEVKTLTKFYDKYGVPYSISEDGVLTTYTEVTTGETDELVSAIYEDIGHMLQEVFGDFLPVFAKYSGDNSLFTRESLVMMLADIYKCACATHTKVSKDNDSDHEHRISELSNKLLEKDVQISSQKESIRELISENDRLLRALINARCEQAMGKSPFLKYPSSSTCSTDGSKPKVSTALTSNKIDLTIKSLNKHFGEDE